MRLSTVDRQSCGSFDDDDDDDDDEGSGGIGWSEVSEGVLYDMLLPNLICGGEMKTRGGKKE
jgi:hypothetical protein